MPTLPERPKIITGIIGFQKLLAGIAGSMFVMALITLIPFVESIFKTNMLLLSNLRMGMAAGSLIIGCFIGIPQILSMARWISEFYKIYERIKEVKDREEGTKID